MDQRAIGRFIMAKRRERNLTQEQLATMLGVSNKTVSKWETGKCMPDYGIVQPLCAELGITVAELMDGEEGEAASIRAYDEQHLLDLLERVQSLEQHRNLLLGLVLVCMGIALLVLSNLVTGSGIRAVGAGALLGIAIGETLLGAFVIARALGRR